jgi:two-component system cell cycle sensor histidine kinase/response regulator CckA
VADSGDGTAPDVLNRIFEPFFTTKERGRGAGLGLAAVYGTVKNHKGTLAVTSEVAVGTVRRMYLPRRAELEPTRRPMPAPARLGRKGHVMVVEDENALRQVEGTTRRGGKRKNVSRFPRKVFTSRKSVARAMRLVPLDIPTMLTG